ncbi:MAG: CoA transferase [Bacteroidetes bacterium]|nr:MAG: CoA transferase [Bacteroidota bacterium]
MEAKTVLSLEQALALPYTTQRFVHLGWRVIRLESTAGGGDPNRYIGSDTGIKDLHSYFIAPNIGKEAITINLKLKEGQELLKKVIKELKVDIFLCNTLPIRYKQLGIDFENLKEANPNLIWCGISALGPDNPDVAGYDPALQAMLGCMHLTGEPDRDPMLCGIPLIDLKAGDEAFTQVLLALLEQKEKSGGREIFISMAQCFTSWLITALPELVFNPEETFRFTRSGNEHRSFIPCNCYQTKDGYVYLAIGNDIQWEKLTKIKGFEHITKLERITNAGRMVDKNNIYDDIRKGTKLYTTIEFIKICIENGLAVAPVNTIPDVANLEFVRKNMLKTNLPSGETVELFPASMNTDFLNQREMNLDIAPRLGEHNERIFKEIGLSSEDIEKLKKENII